MNRQAAWAVFAIGSRCDRPFAIGLLGKTAAGQRMVSGFQSIMQPDQLNTMARDYDELEGRL